MLISVFALLAVANSFASWPLPSSQHAHRLAVSRRAKRGLQFRRVHSTKVDKTCGVMCDQTIFLAGKSSQMDNPEQLRSIRFKDETGKMLVFLTNNMTLPAASIAVLYKSRWYVELFFKWIKQHLYTQYFWALVRTQCAFNSGVP